MSDRHTDTDRPRRRQHDYIRRGTFTLCCIQRLRDGKVHTRACSRHTSQATATILARYLRRHKASRVAIILDNLSVHISKLFREILTATGKQIELAFTPYYASWANSAEWYFNHLQRDLLLLATTDSVPQLINLTSQYNKLYNRERAAPVTMPGLAHFLHRSRTSKTEH